MLSNADAQVRLLENKKKKSNGAIEEEIKMETNCIEVFEGPRHDSWTFSWPVAFPLG